MISVEYKKSVRIRNKDITLSDNYLSVEIYNNVDHCKLLKQLYLNSSNSLCWNIKIRGFEDELISLKKWFSNYDTKLFSYSKKQFIVRRFSELFVSNINIDFFNSLQKILDFISGDINILLFKTDHDSSKDYISTTLFQEDTSFLKNCNKIDSCPIIIYSSNEAETFVFKKSYFDMIQNSIDRFLKSLFQNND